jgi:LCP family protein required for cell wall assembly
MLLGLFVVAFAAAMAYGALVLLSRIDSILFPGTNINISLPGGVSLPGVDNKPDLGRNPINILIMGLDRRPYEGQNYTRTDTMIVATIDYVNKTAGLLGIPRDTWVEIPNADGSSFNERINTALEFGKLYDYPGGGVQEAKDTLKRNFNIDVDHYVIIDFQGFKQIIDDLGGIDIDVPTALDDELYSDTELPGDYFPLHFEPGMQHMDGRTALGYARSRNTTSDLDRIQRQQRVIFAVMDKLLSMDALPHALDLWHQYKQFVDTDLNDFEITGLAPLSTQIPPENIAALSLAACVTAWTTPQGAAVLLPSEEGCAKIINALFLDHQLIAERATVEVRDGTGAGITQTAVELLTNLGFPQGNVIAGDDLPALADKTEIIDYRGNPVSTSRIAEWLGVPSSAIRNATSADTDLRTASADIVVVLGADADVTGLSRDTSQ